MRRAAIAVVLVLGLASLPLHLNAQAVDSAAAQVRRTVFAPWLGRLRSPGRTPQPQLGETRHP